MAKFKYGCKMICNEKDVYPAMKQLVEKDGMSIRRAAKFVKDDSKGQVTEGRAKEVYRRRKSGTCVPHLTGKKAAITTLLLDVKTEKGEKTEPKESLFEITVSPPEAKEPPKLTPDDICEGLIPDLRSLAERLRVLGLGFDYVQNPETKSGFRAAISDLQETLFHFHGRAEEAATG